MLLVAPKANGRRPASFWRFEGAPPPGAGKTPILALHGLGLDGRVFEPLAPLARARDLVLWNLPNELPPAPRMEDLAALALEALDAAGHAGRKAVLLGNSFGGMIALGAALERPDRAAALVLIGAAPSWGSVAGTLRLVSRIHPFVPRRAYPATLAAVMLPRSRHSDPEARERLAVQMRHRTKACLGSCIAALRGFDATPRLASVKAPTLVLHGDRDVVLPPGAGAALAGGIPGATLLRVPECGHMPHWTRTAHCLEAIGGFLARNGL